MKITFIGLGNMGSGIAKNIQDAGFDLTLWNRTPSKMEPFLEKGAKGASTAAEAVADADVVITSLLDDKSIDELLVGGGDVLSSMKPGAIHLCVTTISPKFATYLNELHKEHGTQYLSGPVAGRPDAAESGTLTTFLAGNADAAAKVTPVCESYSAKVAFVSEEPQVANLTKLAMNYLAIASIEAMSEAYAMMEANGVDVSFLSDVYASSLFAHPALKMYAKKIAKRDFHGEAGFTMTTGLKDVRLMISTAKDQGVYLDIAHIIEGKMMDSINNGMEKKDWSTIYEITRSRSGLN